MKIIVGYNGFVGSNLCQNMKFDGKYNSKNIEEAYGFCPDVLVYSGVRGTKFLANAYPEDDRKNINDAIYNITKINPKKLVLISTVDVYDNYFHKDEDYISNPSNLCTYGRNRLELENWVKNNISDYYIIRIPALYGINLKKNFIYDLMNPIPVFLKSTLIKKISKEFPDIYDYYLSSKDGLFEFNKDKSDKRISQFFYESKYNSIYITDSRAEYQFFNLKYLSRIIDYVIEKDIHVMNVVTEPISSRELYYEITGKEFVNEIDSNPIKYNLFTKYNQECHYISDKENVLKDLLEYIRSNKKFDLKCD